MDPYLCDDCRRSTAGNCGQHGPTVYPVFSSGYLQVVEECRFAEPHIIQHNIPHCPGPKLVAKLEAAELLFEWAEHRDHTCGYHDPAVPAYEMTTSNGHRFWCTCGLSYIMAAWDSARSEKEE